MVCGWMPLISCQAICNNVVLEYSDPSGYTQTWGRVAASHCNAARLDLELSPRAALSPSPHLPTHSVRIYFMRPEQFPWVGHSNGRNRREGGGILSNISTALPFHLAIIASAECEILPFSLSSDLCPFCSGLNNSCRCKTVKNQATGMH